MAFSFHAAGTRGQVIAQLQAAPPADPAGQAAAQLAAAVIRGDHDTPAGPGQEIIYVVRGSGHSGGGIAASVRLEIEPLAVPVTTPAQVRG